jgi:hypothetical protein
MMVNSTYSGSRCASRARAGAPTLVPVDSGGGHTAPMATDHNHRVCVSIPDTRISRRGDHAPAIGLNTAPCTTPPWPLRTLMFWPVAETGLPGWGERIRTRKR